MKKKLTATIFFNYCFDKRRFRNFLQWFFKKNYYGQSQLLQFLEKLKFLGFHSATEAGFSISIEDLKIPESKSIILLTAENTILKTDHQMLAGNITMIERYQRIIETWNRTSENLKYQVLQYFQISNFFNPVYLMAFSGARGNISQIRQLVGMRGLMADHQGQIIDFPIRSNFREGLTLTEYLISCSGARKGIVDTALRTAASGYLTRRLVDVAHHVIISQIDCQQPYSIAKTKYRTCLSTNKDIVSQIDHPGDQKGIILESLYDKQKKVLSLQQRLIGRILAETIIDSKNSLIVGLKNKEISKKVSQQICKYRKKILVRSPLTCQSSKFICQLCYGWNLAEGQLVSIGEAVGVLAAQSIGEPGTQLTMRTFHTGGVFTGILMDQIYAPFFGKIYYRFPCQGILIRTPQGKIAYLSKSNGILRLLPERAKNSKIRRIETNYNEGPLFRNNPFGKNNSKSLILKEIKLRNLCRVNNLKIQFKIKKISTFQQFVVERKKLIKKTILSFFKKEKLENVINKIKTNPINSIIYQNRRKYLPTINQKIFVDSKLQFKQTKKKLKNQNFLIFHMNQLKKLSKKIQTNIFLNSTKRSLTKEFVSIKDNYLFISKIISNISKLPKEYKWYLFDFEFNSNKIISENQNTNFSLTFQNSTLLYVRQEELVKKSQLIVEFPYQNYEKLIENEQEILSNIAGEIYFENFVFLEKTNLNFKITKNFIQGLGEFWILFGQSFKHFLLSPKTNFVFLKKLDLIDQYVPFSQFLIEPYNYYFKYLNLNSVFPEQLKKKTKLFFQQSYTKFNIGFIFFKDIGYLQKQTKQRFTIKKFLPQRINQNWSHLFFENKEKYIIREYSQLNKENINKWKFRKNIQKKCNINLKTFIIGLKLQTKYIQEYSNFTKNSLNILIKNFGIQFFNFPGFQKIKGKQLGLHSFIYETNFLNCIRPTQIKYKKNIFVNDPITSLVINDFLVYQKFFCVFQDIKQFFNFNNLIDKNIISNHFFLYKQFCLLSVNRQGIVQSLKYDTPYFYTNSWKNNSHLHFNLIKKTQSSKVNNTYSTQIQLPLYYQKDHVNFQPQFLKISFFFKGDVSKGVKSDSFKNMLLCLFPLDFAIMKKRWSYNINKYLIRKQTNIYFFRFSHYKKYIPIFLKIKKYYRLKNKKVLTNSLENCRKYNNNIQIYINFWLLPFSFCMEAPKLKNSFLKQTKQDKTKKIQSIFYILFLKQSKLVQNVSKNWWRQKIKNKAKIIHWLNLPIQKYFFLTIFLHHLILDKLKNQKKRKLEKTSKSFLNIYDILVYKKLFLKPKYNKLFVWQLQQRKKILQLNSVRIGLYVSIRIFLCFKSFPPSHNQLISLIKSNIAITQNRTILQIIKNKKFNFNNVYFCKCSKNYKRGNLNKKKALFIDQLKFYKTIESANSNNVKFHKILQKILFLQSIKPWIQIQNINVFSSISFASNYKKERKKNKKKVFSNFFINGFLTIFLVTELQLNKTNETKQIIKHTKIINRNLNNNTSFQIKLKNELQLKKTKKNIQNFYPMLFEPIFSKKFKRNFKNTHLNLKTNFENSSFSHWMFFGDYTVLFDKKQHSTYFKYFIQQKNCFSEILAKISSIVQIKKFRSNSLKFLNFPTFNSKQISDFKNGKNVSLKEIKSRNFLNNLLPQSLILEDSLKNKIYSVKIQKLILDFYFNTWITILKNFYFIKNFKIRFLQHQPQKPIFNTFIFSFLIAKTNAQNNLKLNEILKNENAIIEQYIKNMDEKQDKLPKKSKTIANRFLQNYYTTNEKSTLNFQNFLELTKIDSQYTKYIEYFSKKSFFSKNWKMKKNNITYSTRYLKSPLIKQKFHFSEFPEYEKFKTNSLVSHKKFNSLFFIFQQKELKQFSCFRVILEKKKFNNFFNIIFLKKNKFGKYLNLSKLRASEFKLNQKINANKQSALKIQNNLLLKNTRETDKSIEESNYNKFYIKPINSVIEYDNLLVLHFKVFGIFKRILFFYFFKKTDKSLKNFENIKPLQKNQLKIKKDINFSFSTQTSNLNLQLKHTQLDLNYFYIPSFQRTIRMELLSILPILLSDHKVIRNYKKNMFNWIWINSKQYSNILNKFKIIYKQTQFFNLSVIQNKSLKINLYSKAINKVHFKLFEKHFLNSHEKQLFLRFFLPFNNCEIVDRLSTNLLEKEVLFSNIFDFFAQYNYNDYKSISPLKISYKKKYFKYSTIPGNFQNRINKVNTPINFAIQNKSLKIFNQRVSIKKRIVCLKGIIPLQKEKIYKISRIYLKKKFNNLCLTKNIYAFPKILQIFKLNFFYNKNIQSIYSGYNLKPTIISKFLLGAFLRGGDIFNNNQRLSYGGQFIAKTQQTFLFRKALTHLLNNPTILYIKHGAIISKNQRLCSVFFSQSKTGDIIQGIPKIEEIFEARKKSKYSLHGLSVFTKDEKYFEQKIIKYLQNLQKSVVNNIQRIYCGQGVYISDKHIEIIVRQMTSNVSIIDPGQTGLLYGEIVSLQWISRINLTLPSHPILYEPILLGMTKTCLETSSFLSAASFQETTRILSRAALQNQIDFIRGLKQNVILGNLIPIGTGCFSENLKKI